MENIECESAIINFNDKRIVRQVKDDFYQLDFISKYCEADLKTVGQFLNSQKFDFFLNLIDENHKVHDYVYLIKQPFGIKFGNVINIDQECFLNELNTDLKRFVFVSDSEECLQALKIGFSKFKRIDVNEFEMNLKTALQVFDKIVEPYKINEKNENDYMRYYKNDLAFNNSTYISSKIVPILFSAFTERSIKDSIEEVSKMEDIVKTIDKDDYISIIKEEGIEFIYWSFRNTVLIINKSTQEVNLSRLWKSALKCSSKNKPKKFSSLLNGKVVNKLIEKYPEFKPVRKAFKNRPILSGRYGPLLYIHYIYNYLRLNYEFPLLTSPNSPDWLRSVMSEMARKYK